MMHQGNDFQRMADFVKEYIESHDPIGTSLPIRFPFRRRFEHCRRCSVWARRIAPLENADVEIAVISALFHDVGKSEETETRSHGEIGADICNEYLTTIGFNKDKRDHIIRIVRGHSSHAMDENATQEARVVSDTDGLDEIGAITVLWDAMACAGTESPSYEAAYDKIKETYSRLRSKPEDWFHTQTARRILKGRINFLEEYLKNLEYELGYKDSIG